MKKTVQVVTAFIELEGGFWGLISDVNYLPINYPEQLKTAGISVSCEIEILNDMMSFQNWGMLCRIVKFHTLKPY